MNENNAPDKIVHIEGALCQHGPLNQRIYLMRLGDADPLCLIPRLERLAAKERYTKIFAKVPESKADVFYKARFRKEAAVPGFFNGTETAVFLGRYFEDARMTARDAATLDQVLEIAQEKGRGRPPLPPLPEGVGVRVCTRDDIPAMSRLYQKVFPSYPFPIQDPGYLIETMAAHVVYFAIVADDRITALASSEMDTANRNVEMTDFATDPAARGRGLAVHLLAAMEPAMRARGITCAYTISRAASYPINITFAKLGYAYGGRLVNNTNISGQIESMTVWHKTLAPLSGDAVQGQIR